MLLAIDVGNTNTVLGLYRLASGDAPAALVADWRVTTHRSLTVDEIGIIIRDLFSLRSLDASQVTGVIVSSVVPPLDSTLRRAVELYFKVKPLFVEPGVRTGLPILTDNPSEVGADRIVNCVACRSSNLHTVQTAAEPASTGMTSGVAHEPFPIIVVDFGTATAAFDVISPKGEYHRGRHRAWASASPPTRSSRAARLPRVDIRKPVKIVGTNTDRPPALIGLYYGYIGLVDGILARMIDELGPTTRTIATGGLASLIAGGSKYVRQVDEMLTLTGLRLIYERNLDHHPRHSKSRE